MENADFEKHVKEIAKKEPVSWVKTHNPARLVEALREEYSNRELLKKEAEIKRFMKFTKHGLNFSFRDHFDSVSHPSDDISSSTDTSSQSTESEPDIDLAEIGQIFEGDGAPHRLPAPILSFRDITALSSRNPLGLLQTSRWKACRAWSFIKQNHVPAIFAEGLSSSSWVSSTLLTDLVNPSDIGGEQGLREEVGQLDLTSTGIVCLWIQPVDCGTGIWLMFNVTDEPKCSNLLIGHEASLQLQTARNAAASHFAAKESYWASSIPARVTQSCPPSVVVNNVNTYSTALDVGESQAQAKSSTSGTPRIPPVDVSNKLIHHSVTSGQKSDPSPLKLASPPASTSVQTSEATHSTGLLSQETSDHPPTMGSEVGLQVGYTDFSVAGEEGGSFSPKTPASSTRPPQMSSLSCAGFSRQWGMIFLSILVPLVLADLCFNIGLPWVEWTSGRVLTFVVPLCTDFLSVLPVRLLMVLLEALFVTAGVLALCWHHFYPMCTGTRLHPLFNVL